MKIDEYIKIPDPVQWRQGMLLSPQHFQQQDLHVDRLTTHKLYVSQPNYWGLIDISIDDSELDSGTIKITRLHAVFPDGEVINFDEDDADEILEKTIGESEREDVDEFGILTISVGVVRKDFTAAGAIGRTEKRYSPVELLDVLDENNDDQSIDLHKKHLQVRLFAGEAVKKRYICIPILKLSVLPDNSYKQDRYHPPMLDIAVSKKVHSRDPNNSISGALEILVSEMRKKATQLICKQSADTADRATIAALMSRLPQLELLLRAPMIHPFQLYLAFVDMVAGFMILHIDNAEEFLRFRAYDHSNPAIGFLQHIKMVSEKLSEIEVEYESKPFELIEDGAFQIQLSKSANIEDVVVDLIPKKGQDPKILYSWFNSALIGSSKVLEQLKVQRVLGANRRVMSGKERVERGLPVRGNIMSVDNEQYDSKKGPYDSILVGEMLSIQGDPEQSPAAIYLFEKISERKTEDG